MNSNRQLWPSEHLIVVVIVVLLVRALLLKCMISSFSARSRRALCNNVVQILDLAQNAELSKVKVLLA